jgi:hypothetical protein
MTVCHSTARIAARASELAPAIVITGDPNDLKIIAL